MEKVTLDSLSPTPMVMKISLLAFKIVTKSGKYSKIYFSLMLLRSCKRKISKSL